MCMSLGPLGGLATSHTGRSAMLGGIAGTLLSKKKGDGKKVPALAALSPAAAVMA